MPWPDVLLRLHIGLTNTRALNFNERPPGLHKRLWNWCQRQTDPTIKQTGASGLRMYSLRISDDYDDIPIPIMAGEVKTQLSRARAFKGLVAQSNGQTPRAALAP